MRLEEEGESHMERHKTGKKQREETWGKTEGKRLRG
jgi:hypothetical protein